MNGNFSLFIIFKDFFYFMNSLIVCQNSVQMFGHVYNATGAKFGLSLISQSAIFTNIKSPSPGL